MARFANPKVAIRFLVKHDWEIQEIAAAVPCNRSTIYRISEGKTTIAQKVIRKRLQEIATAEVNRINKEAEG